MQALDDTTFDTTALRNDLPVLVDFWAPWCSACKLIEPMLESLEAPYASRLVLAKVDADEVPGVTKQYSVRGLPTLILFRGGAEVARTHTGMTATQMKGWLALHGVDAPEASAINVSKKPGAFFGDPAKKAEVLSRVLTAAAQGRLVASQYPLFEGDRATISTWMSDRGGWEELTPRTGLPTALVAALDFVGCATAADVGAVFDALPVGADVDGIAPRLIEEYLSDGFTDWPGLIGDAAVDALRQRWLALARDARNGQAVTPVVWAQLRSDAMALYREDDPYRLLPNTMIQLIAGLSPPPGADEVLPWLSAFYGGAGTLKRAQAQAAGGWGAEQFALEPLRNAWFVERYEALPKGERATDEMRAQWESEWRQTHAESDAIVEKMAQNEPALMAPINAALVKRLVQLCTEAGRR